MSRLHFRYYTCLTVETNVKDVESVYLLKVRKQRFNVSKTVTVKISCKGAGTLALTQLTPLQGAFKILTDENRRRLVREIMTDGFIEPISVWEDPKTATIYILNGHQRFDALTWLKEHGWTDADGVHWKVKVPQIPITYVEADDLANAKRKVLALASQYGAVSTQGLRTLIDELGIPASDLSQQFNFPEVDIASIMSGLEVPALIGLDFETSPRLTDRNLGDLAPSTVKSTPAEMPALNTGDREPFQQVAFHLHDEQAEIVKRALSVCLEKFGEDLATELTENKNSNAIEYICQAFLDANES